MVVSCAASEVDEELTKSPNEYKPAKIPKYADADSQVAGSRIPRITSDHWNFSCIFGLELLAIAADITEMLCLPSILS